MTFAIKRKPKLWEKKMIQVGKIENPSDWHKVNDKVYFHKFGSTEVLQEEKGELKGQWRVIMRFPEYHKELTSSGYKSKEEALHFAKGYLIKFPYG